jgi:hypothetical protein
MTHATIITDKQAKSLTAKLDKLGKAYTVKPLAHGCVKLIAAQSTLAGLNIGGCYPLA